MVPFELTIRQYDEGIKRWVRTFIRVIEIFTNH